MPVSRFVVGCAAWRAQRQFCLRCACLFAFVWGEFIRWYLVCANAFAQTRSQIRAVRVPGRARARVRARRHAREAQRLVRARAAVLARYPPNSPPVRPRYSYSEFVAHASVILICLCSYNVADPSSYTISGLTFMGLISLIDPPRAAVPGGCVWGQFERYDEFVDLFGRGGAEVPRGVNPRDDGERDMIDAF